MQTLDAYLAEITERLWMLPAATRSEEMRELRQHMEALMARHLEDGAAPDVALTAAIEQFGSVRDVARQRTLAFWRGRLMRATDSTLGLVVLTAAAFQISLCVVQLAVEVEIGLRLRLHFALYGMRVCGILIGLIVGYTRPKRAMAAVPMSYLLYFACSWLIASPMAALHGVVVRDIWRPIFSLSSSFAVAAIPLLCTLSAAAGIGLRRLSEARRSVAG